MTKRGWWLRRRFEERFASVLEAAREGERRCLRGERWGGSAVLMLVDAALDSIGLNYFNIVVPRVRKFWEEFVRTGEIDSFEKLAERSPDDTSLLKIMRNRRVWNVAVSASRVFNALKERECLSDFEALRRWAERAEPEKWREDEIGRIKGVGLVTFQYLRMQAGVDTTMPDKVIKRVLSEEFGINAGDDIAFIREVERFSKEIGYSQIFICWAIWLRESDKGKGEWELTEKDVHPAHQNSFRLRSMR